jgi:xanthine dehydrogenase/oxidase
MRKFILYFNFPQLAGACYMQQIDLSAHGFYITPDIGFDWTTGKGNPFNYFTYGAAFAEVEIDTLTGDFHTRTANIILDLGYSINPAIDVGQVPFLSLLLSIGIFIIHNKLHPPYNLCLTVF